MQSGAPRPYLGRSCGCCRHARRSRGGPDRCRSLRNWASRCSGQPSLGNAPRRSCGAGRSTAGKASSPAAMQRPSRPGGGRLRAQREAKATGPKAALHPPWVRRGDHREARAAQSAPPPPRGAPAGTKHHAAFMNSLMPSSTYTGRPPSSSAIACAVCTQRRNGDVYTRLIPASRSVRPLARACSTPFSTRTHACSPMCSVCARARLSTSARAQREPISGAAARTGQRRVVRVSSREAPCLVDCRHLAPRSRPAALPTRAHASAKGAQPRTALHGDGGDGGARGAPLTKVDALAVAHEVHGRGHVLVCAVSEARGAARHVACLSARPSGGAVPSGRPEWPPRVAPLGHR